MQTSALRGTGIVTAAGEIDLATAPRLREAISDHLTAGVVHLVLDLTAVSFMDSTALGVLVGAGKKVAGLGGSLKVVSQDPRIVRLLAVTGLSRFLPVHPTLEDAQRDGAA